MTPTHVEIACRDETLWLLPDRAVWWPAQRTLLVADAHFGKAATYRVLGQPVPHGTTHDNLARLDALIGRHAPAHLIFLGDFLHGPQVYESTGPTLATLGEWRRRAPGLRCTLVRGNHDARAGDPPPALAIDVVDEPLLIGPFAFCHHPQTHATHYVLAGHEHPAYVLRGQGRDALRLPCYVIGEATAVLPAFGDFTGSHAMRQDAARAIYVAGGGGVWRV